MSSDLAGLLGLCNTEDPPNIPFNKGSSVQSKLYHLKIIQIWLVAVNT